VAIPRIQIKTLRRSIMRALSEGLLQDTNALVEQELLRDF